MNKVVPKTEVLSTALAWAAEIAQNSPDAVQSTKRALLLATRNGSVEDAVVAHVNSKESKRAFTSDNIQVRTDDSLGRHVAETPERWYRRACEPSPR